MHSAMVIRMPRSPDPTADVVRALLARSGNQCAFPDCNHPVVDELNNFVAQVCHIEAASPGGQRYNPASSDEERRSYENLLILCYAHHVRTNDVAAYPPERLREMKRQHEERVGAREFIPREELVRAISLELEGYWLRVAHANTEEHSFPDFAVPIEATATPEVLFRELREGVEVLRSIAVELGDRQDVRSQLEVILASELGELPAARFMKLIGEQGVLSPPFEMVSLAIPNWTQRLHVVIDQLEIHFIALQLKIHPDDDVLRERLHKVQEAFLESVRTAGLAD